jgi:hypothetical protein
MVRYLSPFQSQRLSPRSGMFPGRTRVEQARCSFFPFGAVPPRTPQGYPVKRRPGPGYRGWVAAGVIVVLAEMLDSRTMSSAWREAPKVLTIPAAAYTVAHLYGLIPPPLDLFIWLSKLPVPARARDNEDHK